MIFWIWYVSVAEMNTKNELARSYPTRTMAAQQKARRRKMFIIVAIVALIIAIAVAVIAPVVLTTKKGSSSASGSSGSSTGSGSGSGGGSSSAFSGKSGSLITMEDGTTFTYTNDFGGDWSADPKDPFGVGGKPQSWGKRIGQDEWVWGQDIAYGVNLG